MKRHLPRGRWDRERVAAMSWRELSEVARYPRRGSWKAARRRIHKLERREAGVEVVLQSEGPELVECEFHGVWCTCYSWVDYNCLPDGRLVADEQIIDAWGRLPGRVS